MTIHVYVDKFLWTFSIISFFLDFLHQLIQKPIIIFISMVLVFNSPTSSSSPRTWIGTIKKGEVKVPNKVRKRPTKLVIPEICSCVDLGVVVNEPRKMEFEVEGRYFFLACRRGRREVMEDDYGVITDINGDPKQAFFGVFDGHGGREAVDYVAENLGKNIVKALRETAEIEDRSERAIREGYLTTDKEFLNKGVCSGACVATVLLKEGNLYVANVGDCRVIACRDGVATSLTNDHHLSRDDERYRVESTGGYVNCRNGVWRVQGSLAVSRAIGDSYLKEWIVSEPEIKKLQLTTEYEFLVIASDGLWDKVNNQEAVDVVSRHKKSVEACKRLVDISCSRGNKDDITVMVVDLHNFRMHG